MPTNTIRNKPAPSCDNVILWFAFVSQRGCGCFPLRGRRLLPLRPLRLGENYQNASCNPTARYSLAKALRARRMEAWMLQKGCKKHSMGNIAGILRWIGTTTRNSFSTKWKKNQCTSIPMDVMRRKWCLTSYPRETSEVFPLSSLCPQVAHGVTPSGAVPNQANMQNHTALHRLLLFLAGKNRRNYAAKNYFGRHPHDCMRRLTACLSKHNKSHYHTFVGHTSGKTHYHCPQTATRAALQEAVVLQKTWVIIIIQRWHKI